MRKHRLTYKDLARKLLAGGLLSRDERAEADRVLTTGDALEEARRLGELLEGLARRGQLLRLAVPEDRPSVRRFLDPASNDHWAVELPGPRPVKPRPAPEASAPGPPPEPEAREPATKPESERAPRQPPPPPRVVDTLEELVLEPAAAHRFLDERSGEPLRTLFSTFAPCNTPEELAESLGAIRVQVLERTSATAVRFHLLGEQGSDLTPLAFRGEPPLPHVPLGDRVRDRVLGARRSLHAPDLHLFGLQGALASLPLVSGEQLCGLMEAHREMPGPFDPEELRFFALAALIAAGVVVRAEVLEKLIFIDKLTGLYNRSFFDDQIEREIERANRSNTSVALLMADLDRFKAINDSYGHQAGDVALAHVASLVRANIRQIDVAARYGGEEFAILLPSTTRVRAVSTAERLRRVVSQSRVGEILPDLGDKRLTLSVGVALYPDDAGTYKQLIDRADRVALYAAKNGGRNRVVSWSDARDTAQSLRPGA